MTGLDLRQEWADLLRRREGFRSALGPYGELLARWAGWPAERPGALGWSAAECRTRWERGVPLAADAPPAFRADDLEDLLGAAMELVAGVDDRQAPALQRLAQAWDRGEVGPAALLPAPGRIGSGAVEQTTGLPPEVVGFLACASLRPALEAYFAPCRAHLADGVWTLGACPWCGAPPGFTDVIEEGRRRLACHLCGGGWVFAKTRCPFCGVEGAKNLVRLAPEDAKEEGYLISACRQCRAYLKELDRRVRWNGGPALVEDWGSPHFDLIARREGYWRAVPTLVDLAPPG